MSALDIITQMKSQGKSEPEIIQALQSQGIPPKDIQDALSQAQIKSAISGDTQTRDMQQSIMDDPPSTQNTNSQMDQGYNQNYEAQPNQYQQDQYSTQDPYAQDPYSEYVQGRYDQTQPYGQGYSQDAYGGGYAQDQYAGEYTSGDSNTLIEISEQVFSEKIKKVQDTIDTLNEFKTLTDAKVKIMEERLKRIESTIDQLQSSVLDHVGSYGKNLNSLKKEMNMMQDSFGKVINPLLDRKSKRR